MIVVFEIGGLALLGVVVWVLFRAARARPDQPGMRTVAWLGLGVWLAFGATLFADDLATGDPLAMARGALIAAVILAAVLGYRNVLGRLRTRAARRQG